MRIYVFVSDQDSDIIGFTSDETGSNLPGALGPWYPELSGIVVVDTDGDPISYIVCREGYCVLIDPSEC
jgi:hypothetical protein